MSIQLYSDLVLQFQGDRQRYLIDYAIGHYGWSKQQANCAFRQYLMFLAITSVHQSSYLVPTEEIDCIWEADILHNTALYMQTCQQLCGRIIHHAAEEEIVQRDDFPGIEVAFMQTRTLFCQYFGEQALGDRTLKIAACGVMQPISSGNSTHKNSTQTSSVSQLCIS